MQKSTKLTLGASKIAFCAGDDLPRAKGTCPGWGIRGGECERAGIAPSPRMFIAKILPESGR